MTFDFASEVILLPGSESGDHPPLHGVPGSEKAKMVSEMMKCVPKETRQSMKGFNDGQISPIQYALAEVIYFVFTFQFL